jgi:hypothetical protein
VNSAQEKGEARRDKTTVRAKPPSQATNRIERNRKARVPAGFSSNDNDGSGGMVIFDNCIVVTIFEEG